MADFVRWGASVFAQSDLHYGHGTDNPLDEALALVLHSLGLDHEMPDVLLQSKLLPEEKEKIAELLLRRVNERTPVPYLTGKARFMGLEFFVDERVLIPRSPIAELIKQGFSPWLQYEPERILDLCTGSGCIAIACAYLFADSEVDAVDISQDALAVAGKNVAFHQLDDRVHLLRGDLFEPVAGRQYDLIVSNPPYVGRTEFDSLPEEYRHEPELALLSDDNGLKEPSRIVMEAKQHLTENGLLVVEVGNSASALMDALPGLEATWVELENGGDGVFVIPAAQLEQMG